MLESGIDLMMALLLIIYSTGLSTFGSAFMMGLGYFNTESESSTIFGALICMSGIVSTPLGGIGKRIVYINVCIYVLSLQCVYVVSICTHRFYFVGDCEMLTSSK